MTRAALSAVFTWLLLEIVARTGAAVVLLRIVRLSTGVAPSVSEIIAAGFAAVPLSMAVLGLVFLRRARLEGLDARALGYRTTWPAAAAGSVCGAAGCGLLVVAAQVDGLRASQDMLSTLSQALTRGGAPVVLLLVLGNVLLGPAVEEFVWRGYIQSRLTAEWGGAASLVATALLFAAKHATVDRAVDRPVTLVAVAVWLGLVAQRWGTAASTVTHVIINAAATAIVVLDATRL